MSYRKLVVLSIVTVMATGLAALVRAQQVNTARRVATTEEGSPGALPSSDMRARPIGEIMPPKSEKLAPPRTSAGESWKSEPLAPARVVPTSNETPASGDSSAAPAGDLSQKLQTIRRSITSETASPTEEAKPIPVPTAAPKGSTVPRGPRAPAVKTESSESDERSTSAASKRGSDDDGAMTKNESGDSRPSTGGSSRRSVSRSESESKTTPIVEKPASDNPPTNASATTGAVLSSRGPQLRVETTGPKALTVNKPATYTVTISNGPGAVAQGVEAVVDLPPSITLANNQVTGGAVQLLNSQQGAAYLKWNIPSLDASSKAQLTLTVTPNDARPVDLRVEWACQSQVASARVEVQEPKLALALDGPHELMFGEKKNFRITVSNPGTGDAENVMLVLPASLRGQSPAERSIGTVRAGQKKELEIEVVPREAGPLQMALEARADGNLKAGTAHELVVRRANLQVKIEAPKFKYAGTEGVFRLNVTNGGDAPAENVVASVSLPSGVQLVSASDSPKTGEKGRLTWTVGKLPPGGAKTFELRCQLATAGETHIEAIATAAGELVASQVGTTQVETLADLKLEVTDPQGPIQVGDDVKYEIRVTNRGTKAAQQVRIHAFFSDGLEPLAADGSGARLAPGQVTFDPLASIEPGQRVKLLITARAGKAGDHRFRSEVEYGTPVMKLAAEDTTRFFEDENTPVATKREPTMIGTRPTAPSSKSELKR